MNDEQIHLSYFHQYLMLCHLPDMAREYDHYHALLADDPDFYEYRDILRNLIDDSRLRDIPKPTDYEGYEVGRYKRAIEQFRRDGSELIERTPLIFPRAYTLSAFHECQLHQRFPKVGLRYGQLQDQLASDPGNPSVIETLRQMIEVHGLRSSRTPAGYDVATYSQRAKSMLERNRQLDRDGLL